MPSLKDLLIDVRYALRTLRLNPGFASVAVLSLALGIGANTAIFSLVDAVLMRALPVADPERLVLLSDPTVGGVSMGTETGERSLFTYEEFETIRDRNAVFSGVFAAESNMGRLNVRAGDGPVEQCRVKLVSGEYFPVLGIHPAVGRTFSPAEETAPGADPVVVLAYDYWQTRFGRDRSVIGRAIQVNRVPLTVIGVAQAGFRGEVVGESPDLYVPMMMEPQLKPGRFWLRDDPKRAEKVMWLHVGARLKPGVDAAKAQANVDVFFKAHLAALADGIADPARRHDTLDQRIRVRPAARGASPLRERFGEVLVMLMGMVGFVLLIACANVANLLLARATARQREVGIRIALGAGRARLIRQMLTESVVLAAIGAVVGVLFASWAARLLVRLASGGPTTIPLDVRLDVRLLAFTAALAVLTGLLFGLVPALRASRLDVNGCLKERARGIAGSGTRLNAGKLLVVAQIAISLLLLVGAGLFVRTLQNLQAVELGLRPDNLFLVRIDPVSAGYADGPARAAVYQRLLERFKTAPGVRGVTVSENGIFSGTESADQVTVEGFHSDKEADNAAGFDEVGPAYFSTLGARIVLGRDVGPVDAAPSPRVCVINEAFAKFFFKDANPIGRHVTDEFPDTRATFEIVGVVGDVRDHQLRGDVPRRFYVPIFNPLGDGPPSAYFEIRTSAKPDAVLPTVRRLVEQVDASLQIVSARSLTELLDRATTQERMIAQVSGFFGVLALVLAAIGLYGVLAYSIARRTHEIGIRMALGAGRGTILSGVLRETLLLVGVGTAVGLPAAFACGRLVRSSLYGLAVMDPLTLGVAVGILTAVAIAAASVPARRASRIDPLIALRWE
jgi:predicted permease